MQQLKFNRELIYKFKTVRHGTKTSYWRAHSKSITFDENQTTQKHE